MFDFGRFVAGAELDWDRVGLGLVDESGEEDVEFAEIDSIARAKLRLGFDAGRVLPYVTAGIARASLSYDEDAVSSPYEESYDGQFVGLGASYMASERLMMSIEALRHTFDETPDYTDPDFNPDFVTDTTISTVTLRGSFRF
jgi:opacity protein-like surface antigen